MKRDETKRTPVDIGNAHDALQRWISGKGRMCIPVQHDDDDFIISDALDELAMYRDLTRNMYESMEALVKFLIRRTKTDTRENNMALIYVLPDATAALERYDRQVKGENVGCVPRIEDELATLRRVAKAANEFYHNYEWAMDSGGRHVSAKLSLQIRAALTALEALDRG